MVSHTKRAKAQNNKYATFVAVILTFFGIYLFVFFYLKNGF